MTREYETLALPVVLSLLIGPRPLLEPSAVYSYRVDALKLQTSYLKAKAL